MELSIERVMIMILRGHRSDQLSTFHEPYPGSSRQRESSRSKRGRSDEDPAIGVVMSPDFSDEWFQLLRSNPAACGWALCANEDRPASAVEAADFARVGV